MQRMNGRLAEATYATEAATAKGAALQERLQGALAAIASLEAKAADRKAVDRKQTESLQAQYSHEFLVFVRDGSVDGHNLLARGEWGELQGGCIRCLDRFVAMRPPHGRPGASAAPRMRC